MKTKTITVTALDGTEKGALLVICPDCEGDTFQIFSVDEHYHLQCTSCGTTFCQGACDDPKEANNH